MYAYGNTNDHMLLPNRTSLEQAMQLQTGALKYQDRSVLARNALTSSLELGQDLAHLMLTLDLLRRMHRVQLFVIADVSGVADPVEVANLEIE